jgi:hypothetical protein
MPAASNPVLVLDPFELGQQAFLHAEHRVGIDVGIVGIEDVGDQGLVALGFDDVVQMRRPIGMAAQLLSICPTGPSSGIG